MASLLKAGRLLAFSAVTVFSALSISVSPVFATTDHTNINQNLDVLSYEPICSDAASARSFWKVVNKNQVPVTFQWNNVENAKMGSSTALTGETYFTTDYVATDNNNRTEFTDPTHDVAVSRNAQVAACNPMPEVTPMCVDASKHDNLSVMISDDNIATIETKSGLPICDDITLYYSAYIMPSNYDGRGFFLNGDVNTPNPTAYDQYIASSVEIDLKAGDFGAIAYFDELPNTCNNVQLDVYYGPEITVVKAAGHGTQNLLSKILPSTGACPTPGQGGGEETPVTPPVVTPPVVTPPVTETPGKGADTPVVVTPAQPAQLANTGSDTSLPYLVALTILLATSAVALIGRKATRA